MASPVMALCNLIEDIKTKITDAQYMEMLEVLRKVHNEYSWNLRAGFRFPTPNKVSRLAYSIIRSGVTNPGQLAHILSEKGYTYDNYLYGSFKEWMSDISVHIENDTVTIE